MNFFQKQRSGWSKRQLPGRAQSFLYCSCLSVSLLIFNLNKFIMQHEVPQTIIPLIWTGNLQSRSLLDFTDLAVNQMTLAVNTGSLLLMQLSMKVSSGIAYWEKNPIPTLAQCNSSSRRIAD